MFVEGSSEVEVLVYVRKILDPSQIEGDEQIDELSGLCEGVDSVHILDKFRLVLVPEREVDEIFFGALISDEFQESSSDRAESVIIHEKLEPSNEVILFELDTK